MCRRRLKASSGAPNASIGVRRFQDEGT
jgi:hypothetical protein